ncbi:MAG: hypothetical protein HYV97_19005 [Bdellovibrio sp.]|nr:hypothetical protein [Bdellovibrio sp.]
MKHALIWALSLAFAVSTFAAETVTLETEICGNIAGIQHWTFERSGNVTNDVPDYQGYVSVTFLPTVIEGRRVQTTQRFSVKNLVWDKSFKNVLFQGQEGVTVCGKNSVLGTRLSKACGLKFSVRDVVQSQECNNADATVLEGTFFVK